MPSTPHRGLTAKPAHDELLVAAVKIRRRSAALVAEVKRVASAIVERNAVNDDRRWRTKRL